MTPEEIENIIQRNLPGALASAVDLTGTNDHFEVRVVWQDFRGKGLIEQHRIVNQALQGPLEDGRIHALKIKTLTPEQISK
ncbi:MAG: BolA/IbaG family iron-sulfur metabolism protein [Candidatus Omnitrophica bacterium]|nr:BolA/IbaG family iron-sulfur metabolism protein [Candidatus Omnitrophota bacterium]